MIAAPDYIEPVVGWRVWYAVDDGASTSLSSVVHRTVWPRREPLVATCRRFRLPVWPFSHRASHEAPAADCRCGIYAVDAPALRTYLPEQLAWTDLIPVIGRVFLWGLVHEHKAGWRAACAYPQSLFVPTVELGTARAKRVIADLRGYGVPVRPIGSSTAEAILDEVGLLAAA